MLGVVRVPVTITTYVNSYCVLEYNPVSYKKKGPTELPASTLTAKAICFSAGQEQDTR